MVDIASKSSFRDPSGFIFYENGQIFRKINPVYFEIYRALKEKKSLKHCSIVRWSQRERERERERENSDGIVIQPKKIPFISYPYEWSFGQLRDAALLTLTLQRRLLEKNFSLKDVSAYNVQFIGYKPIFIDTLSFEPYREEPWVAFGQFADIFFIRSC